MLPKAREVAAMGYTIQVWLGAWQVNESEPLGNDSLGGQDWGSSLSVAQRWASVSIN